MAGWVISAERHDRIWILKVTSCVTGSVANTWAVGAIKVDSKTGFSAAEMDGAAHNEISRQDHIPGDLALHSGVTWKV